MSPLLTGSVTQVHMSLVSLGGHAYTCEHSQLHSLLASLTPDQALRPLVHTCSLIFEWCPCLAKTTLY